MAPFTQHSVFKVLHAVAYIHTSHLQSLEARRGSFHTIPQAINHRMDRQLQTPTEEPSLGKNNQLQSPTGKDGQCISYKKSTTPATQPVSNHHHPVNSCSSLRDLLPEQSHPASSSSSLKITFLGSVCWTSLCFLARDCLSRILIPSYTPINLFLLVK